MMVRFCPGSAIGTPAWMSLADANVEIAKNTAYLDTMIEAGSQPGPIVYPHIGQCPPTCPKAKDN
jgi:hypothetical protein